MKLCWISKQALLAPCCRLVLAHGGGAGMRCVMSIPALARPLTWLLQVRRIDFAALAGVTALEVAKNHHEPRATIGSARAVADHGSVSSASWL